MEENSTIGPRLECKIACDLMPTSSEVTKSRLWRSRRRKRGALFQLRIWKTCDF